MHINVKQKNTELLLRSTDIAAESTWVVWRSTEVDNKGAEVKLGCKSTKMILGSIEVNNMSTKLMLRSTEVGN